MGSHKIKMRAYIPDAPMLYGEAMYYQDSQYLSSFLRRIYAQYAVAHPSHLSFELEDRLMLFTGFVDVNKKEIYDDDIVLYTFHDKDDADSFERGIARVTYGMSGWVIQSDGVDQTFWEDDELWTLEILGNYRQHPELLK